MTKHTATKLDSTKRAAHHHVPTARVPNRPNVQRSFQNPLHVGSLKQRRRACPRQINLNLVKRLFVFFPVFPRGIILLHKPTVLRTLLLQRSLPPARIRRQVAREQHPGCGPNYLWDPRPAQLFQGFHVKILHFKQHLKLFNACWADLRWLWRRGDLNSSTLPIVCRTSRTRARSWRWRSW